MNSPVRTFRFDLFVKQEHPRPLNQLIYQVNKLSLDSDTKLTLPSDTFNEFEILNTSLNQMVVKLKASIQEIYELEIRESNANLAALQAQVDPHFLYNALNSISAASEVYGSDVTTVMCQDLSSMMRYVTSKKTEVPLIEELTHTKNYLEFMKISNDTNFDYIIDAPRELYDLLIPRLSIQPFAENSFRGFAVRGFPDDLTSDFFPINGFYDPLANDHIIIYYNDIKHTPAPLLFPLQTHP